MAKSPDAFRTISEVADWLGIQAHVLRFWESKFTQVKPIKRAGGRRYYRPADMQLLGGIKKLLHDDGLTIKGVQKILREEGMSHVAAMSAPLDELTASQMADAPEAPTPSAMPVEPEKGVVLSFETPADRSVKNEPEAVEAKEESAELSAAEQPETAETLPGEADDIPVAGEPAGAPPAAPPTPAPQAAPEQDAPTDAAMPQDIPAPAPEEAKAPDGDPAQVEQVPEAEAAAGRDAQAESDPPAHEPEEVETDSPEPVAPADEAGEPNALPAFLRRPLEDSAPEASDNPPPTEPAETAGVVADTQPDQPEASEPEPVRQAPRPRVLPDLELSPEQQIDAAPAALSAAYRLSSVSSARAARIEPLVARLTALRDSMAARRRGGGGPASNP